MGYGDGREVRRKKEAIDYAGGLCGGRQLMFALGVNLIIIPLGLYNGGFMGIAQLMRTFVVSVLHVPVPSGVDLSGILYLSLIFLCSIWD